jgi:putative cardiolipin synthase
MRWVHWLLPVLLLSGCAQLPPRVDTPEQRAAAPATAGGLAERVAPAEARNPGQSGFRLVSTGTEAYALRAYSAQAASTSLDIQTYIWHADLTGKLLARQALDAADRGVAVRILVDDLDARAKNSAFAALDAHPRIEVRMYNPMASREGTLSKAAEFGTSFSRLNHRMHNKSWIVDNRIALVGGRNLGDEYFDAHGGTNFVDLDLLMAGPVVREVSESFDRFWNSPSNYPLAQLAPDAVNAPALAALRLALEGLPDELARSPYANVLREDPAVQDLLGGKTALHWTREWQFVSDDPLKQRLPEAQRSALLLALLPALESARSEVALISPYFVPGENGAAKLVALDQRGLRVRVLTNSLAATDVAAVHGGYARYRAELLAGGVEIWELKPAGEAHGNFSLAGSSGSSLHTKALILDGDRSFVGSYNLDPRSTSLNCEQGVLVTHPALAAELATLYAREIRGERAWSVRLAEGEVHWTDGVRTEHSEPDAGASQRFQAWLMKILPVESQL